VVGSAAKAVVVVVGGAVVLGGSVGGAVVVGGRVVVGGVVVVGGSVGGVVVAGRVVGGVVVVAGRVVVGGVVAAGRVVGGVVAATTVLVVGTAALSVVPPPQADARAARATMMMRVMGSLRTPPYLIWLMWVVSRRSRPDHTVQVRR
jgi:hypothetical protein